MGKALCACGTTAIIDYASKGSQDGCFRVNPQPPDYLLAQQRLLPFRFLEAHEHEALAHHERPLHQHAVLRKQRVRLFYQDSGL